MTARDDYPELTVMARHGLGADDQEAERALDEIDALRAHADALYDQLSYAFTPASPGKNPYWKWRRLSAKALAAYVEWKERT